MHYEKYGVGTPLRFCLNVMRTDAFGISVISRNFVFDPDRDAVVRGILADKSLSADSTEMVFKILIEEITPPNTRMLKGEQASKGDTVSVSLLNLNLDYLTTDGM